MKYLEIEGPMNLDTQDPFEADPIVIGGKLIDDPALPAVSGTKTLEGGIYLHDLIREQFGLDQSVNRGAVELGHCRIKIEWDE